MGSPSSTAASASRIHTRPKLLHLRELRGPLGLRLERMWLGHLAASVCACPCSDPAVATKAVERLRVAEVGQGPRSYAHHHPGQQVERGGWLHPRAARFVHWAQWHVLPLRLHQSGGFRWWRGRLLESRSINIS